MQGSTPERRRRRIGRELDRPSGQERILGRLFGRQRKQARPVTRGTPERIEAVPIQGEEPADRARRLLVSGESREQQRQLHPIRGATLFQPFGEPEQHVMQHVGKDQKSTAQVDAGGETAKVGEEHTVLLEVGLEIADKRIVRQRLSGIDREMPEGGRMTDCRPGRFAVSEQPGICTGAGKLLDQRQIELQVMPGRRPGAGIEDEDRRHLTTVTGILLSRTTS